MAAGSLTRRAYEYRAERTRGTQVWSGLRAGPEVWVVSNEPMAVYRRKYRSGTVLWYFKFQPPGSKRGVLPVRQFGFATKRDAEESEAKRRAEELQKRELAKAGSGVAAAPPKTLAMLLEEFFAQHVDKKLAPKTAERYRQQAETLDPELRAMPLADITPLHLNREWNRLLESGGHTRKDKTPRPLAAKTVRSTAGVVSSALLRAVKWGLVTTNPVANSEPPVPRKRVGKALLPTEQLQLIDSASGPWCMQMLLQLLAATGARRGEALALRWADIDGRDAVISRSLTQTRAGLQFKGTKTERPRRVSLPESVVAALEQHRQEQNKFRRQFGSTYCSDLDLIFANPDGSPLKPDTISASISLLCRRLRSAEGGQPSHAAPQPWLGSIGRRGGPGNGVRAIGALLHSRDGRHLFPRAPRA